MLPGRWWHPSGPASPHPHSSGGVRECGQQQRRPPLIGTVGRGRSWLLPVRTSGRMQSGLLQVAAVNLPPSSSVAGKKLLQETEAWMLSQAPKGGSGFWRWKEAR